MPIDEFSPFTLNEDQQKAAGLLETFLDEPLDQVFILKGHAGTGKTTFLDSVIKYLKSIKRPVILLASTGRAAKIVGEKACYDAETVHKHIYTYDVEHADDEKKIRRLVFRLKDNMYPVETIFIVDECSMISDHKTSGVFIDFGSGKLLSDFFSYTGSRKVIFSGDPCQLPPINALFSPCLDAGYLMQKHQKNVKEASFVQVMRHQPGSGIHFNTTNLRNIIESGKFPALQIKVSGYEDIHLIYNEESMAEEYIRCIRSRSVNDVILLTFSNAKAAEMNRTIRHLLFPGKDRMVKGESLMVMQNNYKFDIANGEHLLITIIEKKSEIRAGLTFLNITGQVRDTFGTRIIQGKLIENLLYAKESGLTSEQEYNLYLDFIIRMKGKGITPKHEGFLSEMLTDPWLNAIRAKFGYAVTCHKAQGGEWMDVFIILEKCLFNPTLEKENQYRWSYTAISRGVRNVHFLDNYCLK
ncbi:MAG: DEAD/DEAH box helicase [Bacteroidetes bacterium]|nr:DEAD/DEAH box helicase [Bacteroidota bacterium]